MKGARPTSSDSKTSHLVRCQLRIHLAQCTMHNAPLLHPHKWMKNCRVGLVKLSTTALTSGPLHNINGAKPSAGSRFTQPKCTGCFVTYRCDGLHRRRGETRIPIRSALSQNVGQSSDDGSTRSHGHCGGRGGHHDHQIPRHCGHRRNSSRVGYKMLLRVPAGAI